MKKKTFTTGIFAGIIAVVLISAAVLVMKRREFIQDKILDAVVKKLQPSLPFHIDSYDLSKNIDYLRVNLTWNGHPVVIAGELKAHFKGFGKGWDVFYRPEIQFDSDSPIHLTVNLESNSEFTNVRHIEVQSDADKPDASFIAKAIGLELKTPVLKLSYVPGKDKTAHFDFKAESAMWTDVTHDQHAVNFQSPHLIADLRGEEMSTQFESKTGEVLWDTFYASLPTAELPVTVSTSDLVNIDFELGINHELRVSLKMPAEKGDPMPITWKTTAVTFGPVASWVLKTVPPAMIPMQGWSDLQFKNGTVESSGSAFLPGAKSGFQLREANLNAENISVRSLSHHLAAKKVSFSIPYRASDRRHQISFEAGQIYFKKIQARLKKTEFNWSDTDFQTQGVIPFEVQGMPLQFGQVKGTFGKSDSDAYQFDTSLKIPPANLAFLNTGLCLPAEHVPPMQAEVDFNQVHFSPGVVDPTGKIILNLFKGKIELNDIGFYDLSTDVPEIDLDIDWKEIDLQTMGDWSKFGEIKGTVEGYARDVVFQSFLPTQYQFYTHVVPLPGKNWVEFSPEAMQNFVKIFTGESLDEQIPGIAGWMMFGWPSHVFGGYDVKYAGILLDSQDGLIKVETLDPPDVAKDNNHFILNGFRFKMPIRSTSYPLILDATAMSNFVHQMVSRFSSLKGDTQNEDTQCNPPEL